MESRSFALLTALLLAAAFSLSGCHRSHGSDAQHADEPAPSVGYAASSYSFEKGNPIVPLVPTSSGGRVVSWRSDLALPAGLTLDTSTGVMSGTPVSFAEAAVYRITAENSGGVSSVSVTIAVDSGVVLELGHRWPIDTLRYARDRLLSDDFDRAILWDATSAKALLNLSGPGGCFDSSDYPGVPICSGVEADMAGDRVVVLLSNGLEVYSAVDGSWLRHIDAQTNQPDFHWGLSPDGSYIYASDGHSVRAWSTSSGTLLFSRAESVLNYFHFYATPGELRIGGGPAGAQVIENIAIPSGTSTLSPPFEGSFERWFEDGERFLTANYDTQTTRVYSRSVQLEDSVTGFGIGVGGIGNYFFTVKTSGSRSTDYTFRVGSASAGPITGVCCLRAASLNKALIAGGGVSDFIVYDISGDSIVETHSPGQITISHTTVFAAESLDDWFVGNEEGVVMGVRGGIPKLYSLGQARSLAGGLDSSAVATASGRVFTFDARTLAPKYRFDSLSSRLEMSDDGKVLAIGPDTRIYSPSNDRSLRTVSLTTGEQLKLWNYTWNSGWWMSTFGISGSGNEVGRLLENSNSYRTTTGSVSRSDDSVIWSDTISPIYDWSALRLHISPDASKLAVGFEREIELTPAQPLTRIYTGNSLSAQLDAVPVVWIDDSRLLVNRYDLVPHTGPGPTGSDLKFASAEVVDAHGQHVASSAIGEQHQLQRAGNGAVYSPVTNTIIDAETGNTLWSSSHESDGIGAVAGQYVFFASGGTIRAEKR